MTKDPLSAVFTALGDRTRRQLVARLAMGDATVNELAAEHPISLQAVSKHLKVLEDAGLVSKRREAQRRPAHLEAEVFDLMTKWIQRYQRQAEERYQRLDAVLADLCTDGASGHEGASQSTPEHEPAHRNQPRPPPAGHDTSPIRQGEAS